MYSLPPRPRRRGCLRGCAGCLFHHPITLLASFFAFVLWLPQLVHVTLYIAAGTEPDPWPLVWTTLLLLAAQLIPRITPMLYRAYLARRALVRDRQLTPTQAPVDPELFTPSSLLVSAGAGAAAQAAEWSLLGHAGGAAAAQAATDPRPPYRGVRAGKVDSWYLWRDNPAAVWTADANASTYHGSTSDADFRAMVAGNTSVRLVPGEAPGSGSLLAASYGHFLSPSDIAAIRPGGPVPYIRLFDMNPRQEHGDE